MQIFVRNVSGSTLTLGQSGLHLFAIPDDESHELMYLIFSLSGLWIYQTQGRVLQWLP